MVVEQLREAAEGQTPDSPAAAAPTELQAFVRSAVTQLNKAAPIYKRYNRYYDGEQPLTFASESYSEQFARLVAQYTENICPTIVDALADRLTITGWDSEDADAVEAANDIWNANRMDERAGEVHQEAAKCGDAYVIVWPDPDDESLITIWPQSADWCTVNYDESGRIAWGAKWWLQPDGFGRLTLYLPQLVVRLVTRNKVRTGSGMPAASAEFDTLDVVLNRFDMVPVFHFRNNGRVASFGRSELRDVIPIQDALNKATADMIVGMEFNAFGQRWATGIQGKLDESGKPIGAFVPGVSRLWTSSNPESRFGEFQAANLPNLIAAQNKFVTAAARVTGTPTHYMLLEGADWPSGESLKTAEARFTKKVTDRQIAFGNSWQDVMTFALLVAGAPATAELKPVWESAAPRSETEMIEVAIGKKQVGVSNSQLQKELGYDDDQIENMKAETQEAAEAAMERTASAFDRGGPPPGRQGA